MITKGTVLKIKGNRVIVFTENSDFIMIKGQPSYVIGQEININEKAIIDPKARMVRIGAVLANIAAVTLIVFFVYTQVYNNRTYSYIDVDFNASISFSINKNAKIVDVKPIDQKAKQILDNTDFENMKFENALGLFVNKSKSLSGKESDPLEKVTVSAVLVDNLNDSVSANKDLDCILRTAMDYLKKVNKYEIDTNILKLDTVNRKFAMENNISMGQYYYQKIKETNENVGIDKSITQRQTNATTATNTDKKQIDEKNNKPSTPVLSTNQYGNDTDGSYAINMNMWNGANGVRWKLYENGNLIYECDLDANTPSPQKAMKDFTNKSKGSYIYESDVIGKNGNIAKSNPITIVVNPPGVAELTSDTYQATEGTFVMTMNLWSGNNGIRWNLYENKSTVCSKDLVDDTPNAQSTNVRFSNKKPGIYEYYCELVNANGEKSVSQTIYVTVH